MADRFATLRVKILADASKFQDAMEKSSGKADKFRAGLNKALVPAGLVGAAIIGMGKKAVDSASRLQQASGGVDSVFKSSAGQIHEWAKGAAQSVGLAESEYSEFATLIGAQLKNAGVSMEDLGPQTDALIRQGADLAATFGGTTSDAVGALSSALKGEMDPIEKYGITLNAATVDAYLAAKGQDKLTGKQKQAAKAQAILALAAEQGADAQGKFAEESNTLAGQTQRAKAAWENTSAALGTVLLPILASVAEKFGGLAGVIQNNAKTVQILAGVILAGVGALFALSAALKVYSVITQAVTAVTKIYGVVSKIAWLSALGPILLVIAIIAAVVAIVVLLWKKNEGFRNFVLAMWAAIKTAATATWNGIKAVAAGVANWFRSTFASLKNAGISLWNAIKSVGNAVWRGIRATVSGVFSALRAYVNAYRAVFTAVFNAIRAVASRVSSSIRAVVSGAFNAIRAVVSRVSSSIRSVFSGAINAMKSAVGGLRGVVSGVGSAIGGAFRIATAPIRGMISAVQTLIGYIRRIKIPKISLPFGIGGGGNRSALASSPMAMAMARGVPMGPSLASRGATGPSQGLTVNISGAIDPEATARQIRRLMDAHDRRQGIRGSGLRTI